MGYTEEYVASEFAQRVGRVLNEECSCLVTDRLDCSSLPRVWRIQEYSRVSGVRVQDCVAVDFGQSLKFFKL